MGLLEAPIIARERGSKTGVRSLISESNKNLLLWEHED